MSEAKPLSIAHVGSMRIDLSRIIYIQEYRHWGYDTTYIAKLDGTGGEISLDYRDGPILIEFWERYKTAVENAKVEAE